MCLVGDLTLKEVPATEPIEGFKVVRKLNGGYHTGFEYMANYKITHTYNKGTVYSDPPYLRVSLKDPYGYHFFLELEDAKKLFEDEKKYGREVTGTTPTVVRGHFWGTVVFGVDYANYGPASPAGRAQYMQILEEVEQ